jgi:hypothetical protein
LASGEKRVFLSGFFDYQPFQNLVVGETGWTADEMTRVTHAKWRDSTKHVLHRLEVETYDPPSDFVSGIQGFAEYLAEKRRIIENYPPFDTLGFDFKFVNADFLVPAQFVINLARVSKPADLISRIEETKKRLDQKDLLDMCLDTNQYPISLSKKVIGQGLKNEAAFAVDDDDVRLRTVELRDVLVPQDKMKPAVAGKALALVLTLGDPFLIAYRFSVPAKDLAGKRQGEKTFVVLANGYHRVYALMKAGYKQVPCVLADITPGDVNSFVPNPQEVLGFIQQMKKPPVFKDFFDPLAITELEVPHRARLFRVSWESEFLPVFDN